MRKVNYRYLIRQSLYDDDWFVCKSYIDDDGDEINKYSENFKSRQECYAWIEQQEKENEQS